MARHTPLIKKLFIALITSGALSSAQAAIIEKANTPSGGGPEILPTSLQIDDQFTYVGSPFTSHGGIVRIFDNDTGVADRAIVGPTSASPNAYFGYDISLSGNKLAIGTYDSVAIGAAYIYEASSGDTAPLIGNNTPNGNQLLSLNPGSLSAGDGFGSAIAIDNDKVVVGAFATSNGANLSGTAYVFDATNGNLLHTLEASDKAANDVFGQDVAISGNIAVVNANGKDAVYVFDLTTGNEIHKLSGGSSAFGRSIAIEGNTIVVGDSGDSANQGAVYVYDASTGAQLAKLTATDGSADDLFGDAVDIADGQIAIGATGHSSFAGKGYLFDSSSFIEIGSFAPSTGPTAGFGKDIAVAGGLIAGAATIGSVTIFQDTSFNASSVPVSATFPLVALGLGGLLLGYGNRRQLSRMLF